jgi:hypothetical protein
MNERLLAAAIIHGSIEEWEKLIKRKFRANQLCPNAIAAIEKRLDSMRKFFRSPWCDVLMCGDGEGEDVLKRLEEEYRQSNLYKQITQYKAKARL